MAMAFPEAKDDSDLSNNTHGTVGVEGGEGRGQASQDTWGSRGIRLDSHSLSLSQHPLPAAANQKILAA